MLLKAQRGVMTSHWSQLFLAHKVLVCETEDKQTVHSFELGPPLPSRNYGEEETGKQRRRRRRNNKNQKQESGLCAEICVHLK